MKDFVGRVAGRVCLVHRDNVTRNVRVSVGFDADAAIMFDLNGRTQLFWAHTAAVPVLPDDLVEKLSGLARAGCGIWLDAELNEDGWRKVTFRKNADRPDSWEFGIQSFWTALVNPSKAFAEMADTPPVIPPYPVRRREELLPRKRFPDGCNSGSFLHTQEQAAAREAVMSSPVSVAISYDPSKLVTRYDGVVEIPAEALGKVESVQFVDSRKVPANPPLTEYPACSVPLLVNHDPAVTVNIAFDATAAADRLAKVCLDAIDEAVKPFAAENFVRRAHGMPERGAYLSAAESLQIHTDIAIHGSGPNAKAFRERIAADITASGLSVNDYRKTHGWSAVKVKNDTGEAIQPHTVVPVVDSPLRGIMKQLDTLEAIDKAQAEMFRNTAREAADERRAAEMRLAEKATATASTGDIKGPNPKAGSADRFWGPYSWDASCRWWRIDADFKSPTLGVTYLKGTPAQHTNEPGDPWVYDDKTGWTTMLDKPPKPEGSRWTYSARVKDWVEMRTATASTGDIKLTIPDGAKERIVEVKVGGCIDPERFLPGWAKDKLAEYAAKGKVEFEVTEPLAPCDETGTPIEHVLYGDPADPKPQGVVNANADIMGPGCAFTNMARYREHRSGLTADERKKIMDVVKEQFRGVRAEEKIVFGPGEFEVKDVTPVDRAEIMKAFEKDYGGRQRPGKITVETDGVEVLPDNILRDKDGKPIVMTDEEFAEFSKPGVFTHNEADEFVNLAKPDGPGNVWPKWVHRNDPTPRPEHVGKGKYLTDAAGNVLVRNGEPILRPPVGRITATTDDGRVLLDVSEDTGPVTVVNSRTHPDDLAAAIVGEKEEWRTLDGAPCKITTAADETKLLWSEIPDDELPRNPYAEKLVLDGLIADAKKTTGGPKEMDFANGVRPGRVVSVSEAGGVYPSPGGSVTIVVVDDPAAGAVPSSDPAVKKWFDETMAGRKAKPRPNPADVVPIDVKVFSVPMGANDFAATCKRLEAATGRTPDRLMFGCLPVATRAAVQRLLAAKAVEVKACKGCGRNLYDGMAVDHMEAVGRVEPVSDNRRYFRKLGCQCGESTVLSVDIRDAQRVEGDLDGLLDIELYTKIIADEARATIAAALATGGVTVAPPAEDDDPQPFVVGG